MTFNVSPGVSFNEYDLTLTIPAVSATPAAFAGIFKWGPFFQRILLGSQTQLTNTFFTPQPLFNEETFFTVWSYLAYGTQAWTVRCGDVTGQTVQQAYAVNGTSNAFSGGNNVVLLGNTAGLSAGMILFYSNNAALNPQQGNGVTIATVNSSSVTLTAAPTANAGNVALIFRSNIFYTAVAQDVVVRNLQWADYNVLNANTYTTLANTFDASIQYVARYPGALGNSLQVSVCETANQFSSNIDLGASGNTLINISSSFLSTNVASNTIIVTVTPANTANAAMVTAANVIAGNAAFSISVGDQIQTGNTSLGFEFLTVANVGVVTNTGNVFQFTIGVTNPYSLIINWTSNTITRYWQYYNLVGIAPGQSAYQYDFGNTAADDQMHIVVTDELGDFTGNPGSILEVYKNVSRGEDNQNLNGTSNYYATVINQQSNYIWWANDRAGAASANSEMLSTSTNEAPFVAEFQYGADGLGEGSVDLAAIMNGYSYFNDPEQVDISLVMTGKALGIPINSNTGLASYLINNLSSVRRDCVVFCSPDISDTVGVGANFTIDSNLVNARNAMPSSSYGFMDSGHKYMYDQYNNQYVWVPLNGDVAGLASQTDHTNAPWWSFAGFNRGNIKNIVSLSWNPGETDRDILYPNGINPVVKFPGEGTILYGDKTLFAEPSAFNRINVRRLFIVLEKAISTAAKFILFEFNDAFTRAQFVSMVNPYLSQIQSQRGVVNFLVRCDATNNTPYVIQNNQFVADIFIQPNYSINWVMLNFVNVPPTISFAEAESIQYGSA